MGDDCEVQSADKYEVSSVQINSEKGFNVTSQGLSYLFSTCSHSLWKRGWLVKFHRLRERSTPVLFIWPRSADAVLFPPSSPVWDHLLFKSFLQFLLLRSACRLAVHYVTLSPPRFGQHQNRTRFYNLVGWHSNSALLTCLTEVNILTYCQFVLLNWPGPVSQQRLKAKLILEPQWT